ncbi:hypothetical protein RRG08_028502 [Elysia crispata]|uniref:Uncharacterized protein n=1 Tax=Elysia crispata TaxID=231223 RepID=A0AAE0ZID6_9GAST|nr:hypothetical protein RRG08_028502 [Elysia crispata]
MIFCTFDINQTLRELDLRRLYAFRQSGQSRDSMFMILVKDINPQSNNVFTLQRHCEIQFPHSSEGQDFACSSIWLPLHIVATHLWLKRCPRGSHHQASETRGSVRPIPKIISPRKQYGSGS